ncbi:MAG: nucleoside deaminase [Erysipelotrichaceae bacterium]|nr:nucleoside deaminase [Erysipelotrichaceae bacterium]
MREEYYMRLALQEAYQASRLNEVPIGCVIVKDGKVIARSYNRKTLDNVATYHAEILAIEMACKKLKTWYLDDCTLYTTVEPCLMCTGAIIQSRISKVVYGTKNDAFGYLSKIHELKVQVVAGILQEECSMVLSTFFKERREKKFNVAILE